MEVNRQREANSGAQSEGERLVKTLEGIVRDKALIIKCPSCDKPSYLPTPFETNTRRKVRCKQCKTIFNVVRRRSSRPPKAEQILPMDASAPPKKRLLGKNAKTSHSHKAVGPPQNPQDPRSRPNLPSKGTGEHKSTLSKTTPFESSEFLTPAAENAQTKLVEKILFGLTTFVTLFLLFIAFRNFWSLSHSDLTRQESIVLSNRALPETPPEDEGLEVRVQESRFQMHDGQKPVHVISGMVFNHTAFAKSNVMLRGLFYDGHNKLKGQVDFPCGQAVNAGALTSAQGVLDDLPTAKCAIDPHGREEYKLILSLSDEFAENSRVDIRPISTGQIRQNSNR